MPSCTGCECTRTMICLWIFMGRSEELDQNGMVCNLVDLDECVQREIVTRYDLENLNMKREFADSVPTTENLCTLVYDILKREFHQAHLERVRLEETMMNSFEYNGN